MGAYGNFLYVAAVIATVVATIWGYKAWGGKAIPLIIIGANVLTFGTWFLPGPFMIFIGPIAAIVANIVILSLAQKRRFAKMAEEPDDDEG